MHKKTGSVQQGMQWFFLVIQIHSCQHIHKLCTYDSDWQHCFKYVILIDYLLCTSPFCQIFIINYTFNFDLIMTSIYICPSMEFIFRTLFWSTVALQPLLCGTWILGLLFLIESDSELLAWTFTIVNSLQVCSYTV